jgi:DNA-directed RNA polymerase subunit N (RpoN/RPB10)
MLTPDYQEFANRAQIGHRDNTVISGLRTGRYCRNRPAVARLPRLKTGTKAELSAYARA